MYVKIYRFSNRAYRSLSVSIYFFVVWQVKLSAVKGGCGLKSIHMGGVCLCIGVC